MVTCLFCEFVALLDHVEKVSEVLCGSGEAFDMVSHSDHEDGTAIDVLTAEPVLS